MSPLAFDAWCSKNGVSLTFAQRDVAHGILSKMEPLAGRATGKTTVLSAVEKYLTEHPA